MLLDNAENNFERGQTDNFGLQCVDLEDLQKIRIGHDGKGFGAGWFLEKVCITNTKSGQQWFFIANRWLDSHEGDGQLEIELPAQKEDGEPIPLFRVVS